MTTRSVHFLGESLSVAAGLEVPAQPYHPVLCRPRQGVVLYDAADRQHRFAGVLAQSHHSMLSAAEGTSVPLGARPRLIPRVRLSTATSPSFADLRPSINNNR